MDGYTENKKEKHCLLPFGLIIDTGYSVASCVPAVSAVGAFAAAVYDRGRVVAHRAAVKLFRCSRYDNASVYAFD